MEIILTHIILAVVLFLIQNWIGERSYSKGYIRFSLLDDRDEALSINFAIKVFSPIVYLILCVALLQFFKLNNLNENIINVVYYYLIFRILLIILYERITIVNWARIFFYYFSIIIVSIIIYRNFINSVETLLPNFSEIKNEIWLLVIVFIYQIGNGIQDKRIDNPLYEPEQAFLPELKRRKKKYINRRFKEFSQKFDEAINAICNKDESFKIIIYSIIIFENFNRPRIIRIIERIYCKFTKRLTSQGIMQINSVVPISDLESVKKGTFFLNEKYLIYKEEEYKYNLFRRIIKQQNPDKKYVRQVLFISKAIIDSQNEKTNFLELYSEIKSEFNLYD